MQQGGSHQGFSLVAIQFYGLSDARRVHPYPAKMIVGFLVFGLNGQRKSFHSSQMQRGYVLRMFVPFHQPARIAFADEIEKVCQGQHQLGGESSKVYLDVEVSEASTAPAG